MVLSGTIILAIYIAIGIGTGLATRRATLEEIGYDQINEEWKRVFILFGAFWPVTWVLLLISIFNGEQNE